MLYIESPSTNPYFNLALEQYVFDELSKQQEYFMLWQNENTIVVGKYQNTIEEINNSFVKEHNVNVVRRLSGGGAVYHDLGNLNFTFITDAQNTTKINFTKFCMPVIQTLKQFGVQAELSGRNDITIEGKKFSGNSQYNKHNRVMHHGTILFNSNLEMVSNVLQVSKDKIESKGIKSVRSRVSNVKDYLPQNVTLQNFKITLLENIMGHEAIQQYHLTPADINKIKSIQQDRYSQWEWNYGHSPCYTIKKHRKVEGCGNFTIHMEVEKGIVQAFKLQGDFFATGDIEQLEVAIIGQKATKEDAEKIPEIAHIQNFIKDLTTNEFLYLLFE